MQENELFDDGEGQAGVCPCCGCTALDYGKKYKDEVGVIYPWKCPKCQAKGKETYELRFSGHYN